MSLDRTDQAVQDLKDEYRTQTDRILETLDGLKKFETESTTDRALLHQEIDGLRKDLRSHTKSTGKNLTTTWLVVAIVAGILEALSGILILVHAR
jgi:hypothetical protein